MFHEIILIIVLLLIISWIIFIKNCPCGCNPGDCTCGDGCMCLSFCKCKKCPCGCVSGKCTCPAGCPCANCPCKLCGTCGKNPCKCQHPYFSDMANSSISPRPGNVLATEIYQPKEVPIEVTFFYHEGCEALPIYYIFQKVADDIPEMKFAMKKTEKSNGLPMIIKRSPCGRTFKYNGYDNYGALRDWLYLGDLSCDPRIKL